MHIVYVAAALGRVAFGKKSKSGPKMRGPLHKGRFCHLRAQWFRILQVPIGEIVFVLGPVCANEKRPQLTYGAVLRSVFRLFRVGYLYPKAESGIQSGAPFPARINRQAVPARWKYRMSTGYHPASGTSTSTAFVS